MSAVSMGPDEIRRPLSWQGALWLLLGITSSLAVSAGLLYWWFDPDHAFVLGMMARLGAVAAVANAVGLLLYWLGWLYSTSIRFTFILMALLVAGLTLFNGWVAAQLMFVDEIVLKDTAILLLFTTIIATTFSLMGLSRTSADLRRLIARVGELARGNWQARVPVHGRDEVARLSEAFNDMAARLQAAEAEQREVEKLRRDLVAWVSHDLRTPLTSIRAMVEALHDGIVDDPEVVQRYYRTLRADVMGLNGLIDDLFALAQIDAGGLKLLLDDNSLADLISDTLESFGALALQRGIVLEGDVDANLDPVHMNSQAIGRVLTNLIGNALRYTPSGGRVRVQARRSDGRVLVTVQDSGPGFAPADLPRVFEEFYRGEGARSRSQGSGAGLGLAIARGFVEAHSGRIWAENAAPGGGACVSFALPA